MVKGDKPIRILQCVSNMDRAGIETMLMNFYRNIDRSKIQFDFLCNKSKPGDYDEEIKKLGGKIYVSPGLNPLKWFKYQKFMLELFQQHPEYKIVHCQNEAMGFPALFAAKKAGIPVRIAHSHNTTTRIDLKWPIKILYKYLLRLVATNYVACGIDAGKYLFGREVKVIHNAIDVKKFEYNLEIRDKIRKKLNIENKYVIGHVGRFEPQKNHFFIIKMFYEYQKRDDNAVLLLVGTGSLKQKIQDKIRKLGIENKVIFTGSIPNVNEIYNALDVFILPSKHEGLPVVGIEAQISNLMCLFSDKITRETVISDNVIFLPINNYDLWIDEILSNKCKKTVRNKKIKNNIYDIVYGVKKLQEYYENINTK